MKISILTPDLSNNCAGRAYLLAKVLQRHYEVEIIGPRFKDEIWYPIAHDKTVTYKSVDCRGWIKPYWQLKKLLSKIEGDVIYAQKPLVSSFGIGLLEKRSSRKPLILDIDDWQMGFVKEHYSRSSFLYRLLHLFGGSLLRLYSPSSYWNNLFSERLTHRADEITVSNNFLKKKFTGTVVCHGRDTDFLNPANFRQDELRKKYGIKKDNKVVMFLGTPRAYKGLEGLIQAVNLMDNPHAMLAIVGLDDRDKYCVHLTHTATQTLGERFRGFGLQSFERIPEFLAIADVVVIPQKESFATIGQIPAKVFDAMAMAKPIVATSVCDLPEILEGCGTVVKPEDPGQLKEAIEHIFTHYDKATEMGIRARRKCIENYSWNVIEKILLKIFEKYDTSMDSKD